MTARKAWHPRDMHTQARAETMARELFPREWAQLQLANDPESERVNGRCYCAMCQQARAGWIYRVTEARRAMFVAFGDDPAEMEG